MIGSGVCRNLLSMMLLLQDFDTILALEPDSIKGASQSDGPQRMVGSRARPQAQPVRCRDYPGLSRLKLPEEVQGRIESGELAPATAYELTKLPTPEAQAEVAARVVAEGLSRDETVEIVKRTTGRMSKGRGGRAKGKPKLPTSRVIRTEGDLRVTIEARKGFDVPTLLGVLLEAVERVRVEAQAVEEQAA
jgi:ParB-like chromosome segregation protein Spo0J